jgi:2-isopropylmalate synthase
MEVNNTIEHTAAEGDGPVNALDNALRKALTKFYPEISEMKLSDYKVRVLNPQQATAAKVRVLIESSSDGETWGTVGVSENIIEASWQALTESISYYLMKKRQKNSK